MPLMPLMMDGQECRLLCSGGGNYPRTEGMVATGLLNVSTYEVDANSDKPLILDGRIATTPILDKTGTLALQLHSLVRETGAPRGLRESRRRVYLLKMAIERHSGGRRDLRKG